MAENIRKLHEELDRLEKRVTRLEKKTSRVSAILDLVELKLRTKYDIC